MIDFDKLEARVCTELNAGKYITMPASDVLKLIAVAKAAALYCSPYGDDAKLLDVAVESLMNCPVDLLPDLSVKTS